MQGDGNLVIRPPADATDLPDPLWDLKTHGNLNAELIVAEDADGSGYIAVVSLDRTEQFFRTPPLAVSTTDAPVLNARTDGTHDVYEDGHGARTCRGGAPSGERRAHEPRAGPVRGRAVATRRLRYVVVKLDPEAGSTVEVGSTVTLTPGVAATTLTFPGSAPAERRCSDRSDVFERAV